MLVSAASSSGKRPLRAGTRAQIHPRTDHPDIAWQSGWLVQRTLAAGQRLAQRRARWHPGLRPLWAQRWAVPGLCITFGLRLSSRAVQPPLCGGQRQDRGRRGVMGAVGGAQGQREPADAWRFVVG